LLKKSNGEGTALFVTLDSCLNCSGSGLVAAISPIPDTENYPHVAIIGGGIGGVALAVACLRGFRLPFTNAITAEARSQGYGLTLQQASKAIKEGCFLIRKR
jgi:hypothetical protein